MSYIGNIEIKNGLILAPMAGVTDAGFRKIACDNGAGLTVTEMVSILGLKYESKNTARLLAFDKGERIKAVQLFGADVEAMKDAAANPLLESFDIIDINMGCPVPKVTKGGGGSALTKNIDLAAKLTEAAVSKARRPVTAKFRLGWDDGSKNYIDFGLALENAGASAVTLHARTKEQMYSGTADYYAIAELRQRLSIPVIANGDITDSESLEKCRKITGCDMFMIGRAAMGRPWIFKHLKSDDTKADTKAIPEKTAIKTKADIIREHIEILSRSVDERTVTLYMRHHISWYLKGEIDAREKRGKLMKCETIKELLSLTEDLQSPV